MLEKFLALVERIADALEVIAAAKTGNETRSTTPPPPADAGQVAATDKAAAEQKAKEEAAAKRKAARDKKAAEEKAKAAAADPLAEDDDLLAGSTGGNAPPKEYTEKEVRDKLAELITKDGRTAAFEVLKTKGGGAKAFTDLKKEHYEDVYVECEERLA